MLDAEKVYSQFAFEAIQVESDLASTSFEEVLYEFVGVEPILNIEIVSELVAKATQDEAERKRIFDQLVSLTFIGPEVREDHFEFTDEPRRRERNDVIALQLANHRKASPRYLVHPAFRAFLEIGDPPARQGVTWD